jgi:hypothetical protein
MSNRAHTAPFGQFARVSGRYNTLAPFLVMTGDQQIVTGNSSIDVTCYNTKIYTTDVQNTLSLPNGLQDGMLKKISLVFKGTESANAIVECPSLTDVYSQITFSNVGDYVLMLWTGGSWCIIESGNFIDPASQSPTVE